MSIIVPPNEVFKIPPRPPQKRQEEMGYEMTGYTGLGRASDGGMLSNFDGFPLPRKGLVYAEAVMANNQVKRITLTMFAPFADLRKGFIPFLESYLTNYCRLADSVYPELCAPAACGMRAEA